MQQMKRLIYQVYVPIRGESKLYNLCVDSVAKYGMYHEKMDNGVGLKKEK